MRETAENVTDVYVRSAVSQPGLTLFFDINEQCTAGENCGGFRLLGRRPTDGSVEVALAGRLNECGP